jgi:hypothetical protein
MINKELQRLLPAGVVDLSAEMDLFLSDDLKDLKLFMLKRLLFFIDTKIKRKE